MILQSAVLHVKAGAENDFESDFRKASGILSRAGGHLGHDLHKCVETKGRYLLTVRWRSLKNHLVGFRQSAEHEQWEALLRPYYASEPAVEHYIPINLGDTMLS